MIYSRSGEDKTDEDKLRIGRVITYGQVWEDKLKELVEVRKLGLRATAGELRVDPNTINCYIKGELRIDPDKIEGLPQPLREQIASTVENFLEKKIVPNLIKMSEGVHNYLEKTTTKRS